MANDNVSTPWTIKQKVSSGFFILGFAIVAIGAALIYTYSQKDDHDANHDKPVGVIGGWSAVGAGVLLMVGACLPFSPCFNRAGQDKASAHLLRT